MVYPLLSPDPKPANRDFPTGFETQKELDPDFIDFNSENRRYHFPARFYLPFKGTFAQLDPRLIWALHGKRIECVDWIALQIHFGITRSPSRELAMALCED
jgi:hypothetical protein